MKSQSEVATAVARFMSERDQFSKYLDIELLELLPGYCRTCMTLSPDMVNGLGMTHGAAIFALADFAFACAGNSYGQISVALSMDIHFLTSPKTGSRLFAEAVEVRKGKRTGLYRITVADDKEKLVAELHGMAYRKNEYFIEVNDD